MGFHEVPECSITFRMFLSPSIGFYAMFSEFGPSLSYLILSYLILSSACQLGSGVGMTSNIQEVILICNTATGWVGESWDSVPGICFIKKLY